MNEDNIQIQESISAPVTGESMGTTSLQDLRTLISKKIQRPNVRIDIPERPGVAIRVAPNISQAQLKAWRRNAGEDSKNGMDTFKFASQVVASTTIAILVNGEAVLNEDGFEVNFASPEVLEMTNSTRPFPDAVRALFGIEPHVEAAAVAILDAAGYGDAVDAVDPTK